MRWEETEIQTIYVAFLLALQASDKPPKRHLVDSESWVHEPELMVRPLTSFLFLCVFLSGQTCWGPSGISQVPGAGRGDRRA